MIKRIMCVVLALVFVSFTWVASYAAAAAPVKQDLTTAKTNELNDFFSKFMYTLIPLSDYDIENMAESDDDLLAFAIWCAIDDGLTSYYSSTDPVNTEDFGQVDIYTGEIYTSENKVDTFLLTLLDVDSIQHRSIKVEDGYEFEYKNNRYYMFIGDGTHRQEPNVIEYYDNGNGTFSAKIEVADYGLGSYFGDVVPETYYSAAVIQPYKDNGKETFQLLYLKNGVEKDEPLPIRQPSSHYQKSTPSAQEQPATVPAVYTNSNIYINDAAVSFTAYNINGNNYFKLRDLALAFNSTDKTFNVLYDENKNSIAVKPNEKYVPEGGELEIKNVGENKSATPTSAMLYVNDQLSDFTAYNIDGNNYYKLRDIMQNVNDVSVRYDEKSDAIYLDTQYSYEADK